MPTRPKLTTQFVLDVSGCSRIFDVGRNEYSKDYLDQLKSADWFLKNVYVGLVVAKLPYERMNFDEIIALSAGLGSEGFRRDLPRILAEKNTLYGVVNRIGADGFPMFNARKYVRDEHKETHSAVNPYSRVSFRDRIESIPEERVKQIMDSLKQPFQRYLFGGEYSAAASEWRQGNFGLVHLNCFPEKRCKQRVFDLASGIRTKINDQGRDYIALDEMVKNPEPEQKKLF